MFDVLRGGATLADWLQGWGSVAAVIATLVLLWHEMREARRGRKAAAQERAEAAEDRELARQDRELAAAERRDGESAQARTVIIGGVAADAIRRSREDDVVLQRVTAWLENFGSGPVIDVAFVIAAAQKPDESIDATTNEHVSVLAPRDRLEISWERPRDPEMPPGGLVSGYYRDETGGNLIRIEVRFTDVAGRRWARINDGQPQRVLSRKGSP